MATKNLAKFKTNADPELLDLFKHYLHVTQKQVADFCRYFNLFTFKVSQVASENSLSLSYFENDVEWSFYSRAYAKMLNYHHTCWGGPLLFIILMLHLTTSNKATRIQVTEVFKNYSVNSSGSREIITNVVDLLKYLLETLYSLKNDTFPDDFVNMVATIFNTTSVP